MRKDYTLGEWLDVWLEYYVEPSALAPSTKACYNRAVRALPASLGSIWVIDIAPLDCLCWIQSVARTHPRAACDPPRLAPLGGDCRRSRRRTREARAGVSWSRFVCPHCRPLRRPPPRYFGSLQTLVRVGRTTGNRVWAYTPPRVQIPNSPPVYSLPVRCCYT